MSIGLESNPGIYVITLKLASVHRHTDGAKFVSLNLKFCCCVLISEEDLDDAMFGLPARHRPEELGSLERSTKFTRKEIQLIYRGFKQVITLLSSTFASLFDVKREREANDFKRSTERNSQSVEKGLMKEGGTLSLLCSFATAGQSSKKAVVAPWLFLIKNFWQLYRSLQ